MNRSQETLLSLLRQAIRGQVTQLPNSVEEWAAVVKEASRHGLGPYLFHILRPGVPSLAEAPNSLSFRSSSPAPAAAATPLPVDSLRLSPVAPPASILENLRRAYLQNLTANLQRFHYLGQALRALSSAGVPVIVLKGAYLAEAVYGNIALRTMCDLDILVKSADLPKADEALRRIGFYSWEKRVEALADTNEFHYNHSKAGRLLLEVHHEPVDADYPFYLPPETLWAAAVPARIAGVDAFALSPEDLIIYQGIHAALHSFSMGLRALVDTREILARLPVGWDALVAQTRAVHAAKPVWMFLELYRSLLGSSGDVPDDVFSSLRPSDASVDDPRLESARAAILREDSDRAAGAETNPKVLLFFGRKGFLTKFSLVFHKAFPSWKKVAGLYELSPRSPLVLFHYPHCLWSRLKRFGPAVKAEVAARSGLRKSDAADSRKSTASLMNWLMGRE